MVKKNIYISLIVILLALFWVFLPKNSIRNSYSTVRTSANKFLKSFDCSKEGEKISNFDDTIKCCSGLKSIPIADMKDGSCVWLDGGAPICSNCGDGICNEKTRENQCSCPEDCKQPE